MQNTRSAFTLIELLVVVALLAVIGTGVVVTYGKSTVTDSKRQMTIHEMGQIRDAFIRFHADNSGRLLDGIQEPGNGAWLPTSDFCGTFTGPDAPLASTGDTSDRVYGMLEFYERYGLWALLQPAVMREGYSDDSDYFISFGSPDPLRGTGWQGPYATASSRVPCYINADGLLTDCSDGLAAASDLRFPQPATRFGGFYRVLFYEYCEDYSDTVKPVYRRLVLMCSEEPSEHDEWDELTAFTGNRRGGTTGSPFPLNLQTGAIELYTNGVYFVELLNLDRWHR